MSRIGRALVTIPAGVTVSVGDGNVKVKGPKGELEQRVSDTMQVVVEGDSLRVERKDEARQTRALHGTTRALIANMVSGVSQGFEKHLDIIGVGYSAELKGDTLSLKLGFSHPCSYEAPKGIEIEVPQPTRIVVRGIDRQLVGQSAADIRALRPPEPYKGKGIRYHNEYIKRKAGKLAVSSGT